MPERPACSRMFHGPPEEIIATLLLIPLDERPINSEYPQLLAAALGWELRLPRELLGSRKAPADTAALGSWLQEQAGNAAGAVIALDTLAWGGLIPSRQSGNNLEAALEQLAVLTEVRRRHPELPLMAFSSIQRVNRDDNDSEEPSYFREHGKRIFRRSVLEHRQLADVITETEEAELASLRLEIPAGVWDDVLAIRSRTHAVNLAAIDLVERGVIDTLILNQDDTTTWGLNVAERARLEAETLRRRLGRRVLVYPGADEVTQVLIARLASQLHGKRPLVTPFFSSRGGAAVETAYEDRPLGDLIAMHLRAAGAVLAPPGLEPDWWLAVNSPSRAQGRGGAALSLTLDGHGLLDAGQREAITASEARVQGLDRSVAGFVDTIKALLFRNRLVSVADVAHSNGADDELMTELADSACLQGLAGYGGWNTAGNALGSAVALGSIAYLGGDETALRTAVAARYLDDWLYQARVRTRLMLEPAFHGYGYGKFLPSSQLSRAAGLAQSWLNQELEARQLPYVVADLQLPWQRLFEIGYRLEPK